MIVRQAEKPNKTTGSKLFHLTFLIGFVGVTLFVSGEVIMRVLASLKLTHDSKEFSRMFTQVEIPDLNYVLTKSHQDERYRINSQGFRGPETDKEKAEGVFRILTLGDSVTFGMGVYDTERIYPALLEQTLNRKGDDRYRYEVLNPSAPGYNTVQQLNYLKHLGLQYQPDLVLVGVCLNDWDQPAEITEQGVFTEGDVEDNFLKSMMRQSYLLNSLSILTQKALYLVVGRQVDFKDEIVKYKGWDTLKTSLREIAAIGDEKGFPVVAVVFPTRSQLRPRDDYPAPQADLRQSFPGKAPKLLDLYPDLKNATDHDLYVDWVGIHLSEYGHRITADRIATALCAEFIDCSE